MATTTTRPRRLDEDDDFASSVFQPTQMPTTTAPRQTDLAGGSGATGTSTPWMTQVAAPPPSAAKPAARLAAAQPVGGSLDFGALVGQPAGQPVAMTQTATPQTAPGLTDASRTVAPTRVTAQNEGQYGVPTDPAERERFYADRNQGDPVAGQPGLVWWHDGSGWTVQQAGATPGAGGPTADPRFAHMQGQTYTPGDIGTDDLPAFSYEELLRRMGPEYQPTAIGGRDTQSQDITAEDFDPYEFGGWQDLPGYDVGAVGDDTDALIRRILANPESLDPRTIAMMQAASREEQAALAAQEADEMTGLGFELGISDSPWLASEQLQGRRNRDAAVIASNRSIETEAAKTNAGDRRAAAALGASYVDSKGRLKLAQRGQEFTEQAEGERNKQASATAKQSRAEYLTGVKAGNADRALEAAKIRMQADIAHNDNLFKAAQQRQDRVLGTVDADLKRAAATTDRIALREQASQAAAELGISRDKLMTDWLTALMDDATQRYGIDIAATVDREQLAQAGSEFKEDLAFRIMALDKEMGYKYAALGESGRQFDYGYGLSAAELQERARQHDDDFYARSQGF